MAPSARRALLLPLPASLVLHAAALAAIMLWVGRALPPVPQATSVEMVWEDTPGDQVAAEAEAPAPPPAPPAPAVPQAEAPPPPPPPAPPVPRFAEAPRPPAPLAPPRPAEAPPPPAPAAPPAFAFPPPPLAETAPQAADIALAPPPPAIPQPEAEAAPEALPLPPPPAPPAPPQRPAAARPAPQPSPPGPPSPPAEAAPAPAAGIGRAAGAVVPPGPDPAFRNAGPPYPEGARLRGETGTVGLELAIGADGRVLNVAVTRSSGTVALDEAARRAALAWRFRPATLDGRPVPGTIRTSVHFRLS